MTSGDFPSTVQDLIIEITEARRTLLDRLAGQPSRPKDPLCWSLAEIVFHLHLTERSIGQLLQKIVASGERHERRDQDHLRAEWDRMRQIAGTRGAPASAPPPTQPLNAPSLPEAIELLIHSRQQLLTILDTLTLDDLASISAPHPFVGNLTGAVWISSIAYHELRHVDQIDELRRASPTRPGSSTGK